MHCRMAFTEKTVAVLWWIFDIEANPVIISSVYLYAGNIGFFKCMMDGDLSRDVQ